VPVELSTPFCQLAGKFYYFLPVRELYSVTYVGHQSIVNTTVIHPHLLHVISSGVEQDILMHSPTISSPCSQNLSLTDVNVRPISNESTVDGRALRALLGLSPDDEETQAHVIEMFDR